MLIDVDFDIGEQLRGVLYLVDQNRRLMKLQKKGGIVLCHIPLSEVIQSHILAAKVFLLRQLPQHGRFARLPGAGQQKRGVGAAKLQNAVFHMSADIFHKAPPVNA